MITAFICNLHLTSTTSSPLHLPPCAAVFTLTTINSGPGRLRLILCRCDGCARTVTMYNNIQRSDALSCDAALLSRQISRVNACNVFVVTSCSHTSRYSVNTLVVLRTAPWGFWGVPVQPTDPGCSPFLVSPVVFYHVSAAVEERPI